MKEIDDLIDRSSEALKILKGWVGSSRGSVEILEFSKKRSSVLLYLQVTTRSLLGAIAYETGGILVEDRWLRLLGSGSSLLPRDIAEWNSANPNDFLLIGDDMAGGFFALNAGALGPDTGSVYYFPPDSLEWEPLGFGYSDFVHWAMSSSLEEFYKSLRWRNWRDETVDLRGDQCVLFYPFLWTAEGSLESSSRRVVSILEARKLALGF